MSNETISTEHDYDELLESIKALPARLQTTGDAAAFREQLNTHLQATGIPFSCSAPAGEDPSEDHILVLIAHEHGDFFVLYSISATTHAALVEPITSLAGFDINVMEDIFEWEPEEAVDLLRVVAAAELFELDELEVACEDLDDDVLPEASYWEGIHASFRSSAIAMWEGSDDEWSLTPENSVARAGLRRNFSQYVFFQLVD